MNDRGVFNKIAKRIDSYEAEMIDLQIQLTAIPALAPENGGDGEYEKTQCLKEYLRTAGFTYIQEFNAPDNRVSSGIRPNIVVTVPGKNPEKTVWIITHTDIVPPGEINLWDTDPYQAFFKDGRVYGRGTEDNQQDLVASIFAAKSFFDESIIPPSTIRLAFVADEETSSQKGLVYLLDKASNLFKKNDTIIVPDFGNEDGSIVEVAEKSILWLRFTTSGKQCHASRPSLGINAFTAASHLVVRLGELYQFFDTSDTIFHPPESTFEPTRKDANVPNINTIPGNDVFFLDCRILPLYDLNTVMGKIRYIANTVEKQFGVSIEIETIQKNQAAPPTPNDSPVVTALQEAIRDVYHVNAEPVGIGGGTVAAHLRENKFPAAVWCKTGLKAHQPNEHCLLANMIGNSKVFAHVCLQQ